MNKITLKFERKERHVDFYNPSWRLEGDIHGVCGSKLRKYWFIKKSARKIEIVLVDTKVPESFEVSMKESIHFVCSHLYIDEEYVPATNEQCRVAERFIEEYGRCFMYVNLVPG